MTNFENFKKKAKDALEAITDVSVEAYKLAEEKTKALARSTKLSADISREKAQIKRLYCELGSMYYNAHKDNPEEAFVQTCTEITSSVERIAEKQKEIDELKKRGDFHHHEDSQNPEPDHVTEDENDSESI